MTGTRFNLLYIPNNIEAVSLSIVVNKFTLLSHTILIYLKHNGSTAIRKAINHKPAS